jgi:putative hydrolase of the HAD superfamily
VSIFAVVFDWGGTLTPWHQIDLKSQWYAFAEHYDPANAADLAQRLFEAEEHRWQVQKKTAGLESTGAQSAVLRSCGVDENAPHFADAYQHYLDFWDPHTYSDPDALPLMRALKERGIKIGVLSNTMWSREHHESIFRRDGLFEYIDAGVYTSELPSAKPHADAFTAILQALSIDDPSTVVFVGDRIWDDIHGAKSAGMKGVFLPHSNHRESELVDTDVVPDAVIQRLGEIFELVRAWQKAVFDNA